MLLRESAPGPHAHPRTHNDAGQTTCTVPYLLQGHTQRAEASVRHQRMATPQQGHASTTPLVLHLPRDPFIHIADPLCMAKLGKLPCSEPSRPTEKEF